jgi:hypothetical protein
MKKVKDSIDAQITDNIGRPAYCIERYIRKDATPQSCQQRNMQKEITA